MPSNYNREDGCGCCLYGPYTLLPIVLCSAALVITWVVTYDCRYFETSFYVERLGREESITVGPWLVEDIPFFGDGSCVRWSVNSDLGETERDGAIRYTRFATMLTSNSAIIMWIVLMITTCTSFPKNLEQLSAAAFFIFALLLIFTLTMLSSDLCSDSSSCELRQDGYLAIAASCLWFGTGLSMLFLPEPKASAKNESPPVVRASETNAQTPAGARTETVEQTIVDEDGTRTTVTTTTVYQTDGSKTVTETRKTQGGDAVAAATAVPAYDTDDGNNPVASASVVP